MGSDLSLEVVMENNFFEDIVKNLKLEAEQLNENLKKYRDCKDMNLYISTLKSLRETLDLINKYDWHLRYSVYTVGEDQQEIAVWEQNFESAIRNHKTWIVAK